MARTYSARVRLNPDEYDFIKRIMTKSGYNSVSEAIRWAINTARFFIESQVILLPSSELVNNLRGVINARKREE